ncbi:GMC oxidoreductase [Gryllotalpicola reticulitermitis]|uniref:GMC oxidoreductase n=1 Tax=Gryllotalpicola reticulitermitis TaxID=1184153 RepID=A0ABV8Q850_9MICO
MSLTEASPAAIFLAARHDAVGVLADRVVPRDDWPSASDAGALEFLGTVLGEREDWIPRLDELLTAIDPTTSEHWEWFAQLISGGFYADPANGGNRGRASWRMLNWRPEPRDGWPATVPVDDALVTPTTPGALRQRYDAIVIGSGAGGGVAAAGLAESGYRVLVVEAGGWPTVGDLSRDHIRNPRSEWNLSVLSGFADFGHPRVLANSDGEHVLRASDQGYSNNASTVGGGTRVYGAQAWRFAPIDFRMASTYGVPAGSSLADWPIGYEDLEPFYSRAEWELGVSGDVRDGAHSGSRSRPYPMPPLPRTRPGNRLRDAAAQLGVETVAPPLLINSRPYLGRLACVQCAQCVGFACPVDAKNGSQNTMLTRAFATGNCSIVVAATAERIVTDASGRVTGVALVGESHDGIWRRSIDAEQVVIAGGAVESARLLLNSASSREPNGLGNNADQVGRHLQGHVYGGATALFEDPIVDLRGPGPSIAITQYRHGNPGIIGGGMIADEFVPTPSNTYRYLVSAGFLPSWGAGAKRGMRELAERMLRVMGPIQEVTSADSRVSIDSRVTDRFGIPVARLSGALHQEDYRARDFLADRASEWLEAAGATRIALIGRGRSDWAPSGGQHQAGTCRMGSDPASSVVDPEGRVWGHDNVRVADGSVHVTNGGVNPVLSILANSLRITDLMVRAGR